MKKAWRILLFMLMVGVFLWLSKLYLDPGTLRQAWKMFLERPELFLYFAGGYSAAFCFRAAAWSFLIREKEVPVCKLFNFNLISLFLNHLLPTKAGEAAKILLLKKEGVPLEGAAASVIYSRLLDMVSLLVILLVCIGISYRYLFWKWQLIVLPAVMLGLAGACLALFTNISLARFGKGKIAELTGKLQAALTDISPQLRGKALLWTIPSWVLETVVLLVVAWAFGLQLSIPAAITVTAFTIMGQVFHFTPGGIGTYESSMSLALGMYGVDPGTGFAVAIMTHGLKFLYSFVAGGIALGLESVALADLLMQLKLGRQEGAEDEESLMV